ncbi:MAG: FGGY-family carbohydrate kinase [Candidatus Lokiarchaeota archaeon]|nr:FGGY-family carbohydrate kinase [Candidatus Lokiarchaeota archaeon]
MRYRMVYDAGSRALKCAIADESNNIIGIKKIFPEISVTEDGFGRSCNSVTFWNDLISLTRTTIKKAKINPKDIRFISACGIRPSCVFTDEENEALFIASAFDGRGIDVAEEIDTEFEEISGKSFYESTGHFPSLLFPHAKFGWIKANPYCLDEGKFITQYLPMESWILVRMGGEPHVNITSAAESGFFDLSSRFWHNGWYDVLDLPEEFFPPPVVSGEIIGNVSEEIQYKLGVSSETELVAGLPDTQSALLASGCVRTGSIGAVLGSTAPVQALTEELIIDADQRTWSSLYVVKNLCDAYIIEPNTGMTGQILIWAANLYAPSKLSSLNDKFNYIQNRYVEWDAHEKSISVDELKEQAVYAFLGPSPLAQSKTELGNAQFHLPTPGGVEEITSSQNAFIAAVYDNILFAVMRNIDYAKEIGQIKTPYYSVTGGASRSEILCQRFADITGTPFSRLGSHEASIKGLLMLCDIADGKITSLEDLDVYYKDHLQTIQPRKDMREKLISKYKTWERIRISP